MPVLQRRPRHVVEDDDEEASQRPRQRQRRDDSDMDADSNGSNDEGNAQQDESTEAQLVKKLVRYAMSCDYSRTPIRRDGIRERVLGSHSRSFRRVFDGAQQQLRAVFGMQMMELPVRDKETMSLGEKRKAAKSQTKGQATSNAYILVSRLPEKYRAPAIITPSKVQSTQDEAAYVGVYTMIVTVITLNGGNLSDAKLRRYLTRMNVADNMAGDKTDTTLQKLIKQGYIAKTIEKRQDGEEESITWTVGPRGKLEVGVEAIAGLVREVYGDATEDLERKLNASLRIDNETQENENGEADDTTMTDGAQVNGTEVSSSRRRSTRHSDYRQSTRDGCAEDDDEEGLS